MRGITWTFRRWTGADDGQANQRDLTEWRPIMTVIGRNLAGACPRHPAEAIKGPATARIALRTAAGTPRPLSGRAPADTIRPQSRGAVWYDRGLPGCLSFQCRSPRRGLVRPAAGFRKRLNILQAGRTATASPTSCRRLAPGRPPGFVIRQGSSSGTAPMTPTPDGAGRIHRSTAPIDSLTVPAKADVGRESRTACEMHFLAEIDSETVMLVRDCDRP